MRDDETQTDDLLPPDLVWHVNAEFARRMLIDVALEAFESGYRGRETLLCYEDFQLEDLASFHPEAMGQVRGLVTEYDDLGAYCREDQTFTWDGTSLPCTCAITDSFTVLGIDNIEAWYAARERIRQIFDQNHN